MSGSGSRAWGRDRPDVVGEAVAVVLERLGADAAEAVHVVDIGGGSGTAAVQIAAAGHRVTVVDPSPNALATLARRAAEAGLGDRVQGVQGDAADAPGILGEASADLVLCHGVLEVVDDPVAAVAGLRALMRPGGRLSVVVAQRLAAVLARARTGHVADAEALLAEPGDRWGPGDRLPRRFDESALIAVLASAGFTAEHVAGLRTVSDVVPPEVRDDAAHRAALGRLDAALAERQDVRATAPLLHVVARPQES